MSLNNSTYAGSEHRRVNASDGILCTDYDIYKKAGRGTKAQQNEVTISKTCCSLKYMAVSQWLPRLTGMEFHI